MNDASASMPKPAAPPLSQADERTANDARRRARASWPVRKFQLGAEPTDDFSAFTVAERLAMTWRMTRDAWASAGRALPDYARSEMPIRVIRRPAKECQEE